MFTAFFFPQRPMMENRGNSLVIYSNSSSFMRPFSLNATVVYPRFRSLSLSLTIFSSCIIQNFIYFHKIRLACRLRRSSIQRGIVGVRATRTHKSLTLSYDKNRTSNVKDLRIFVDQPSASEWNVFPSSPPKYKIFWREKYNRKRPEIAPPMSNKENGTADVRERGISHGFKSVPLSLGTSFDLGRVDLL